MTTISHISRIYEQWIQLSQCKEKPPGNEITPSQDLCIREETTIEMKTTRVWRDIILYDNLTLKSDGDLTRKVSVRYIYLLGATLELKNIELKANYVFPLPSFKHFTKVLQKILEETLPPSVPFQRDEIVHQSISSLPECTLEPNLDAKNMNGLTTLMIASHFGDAEVVRFLLAAKANPDIADADGWTALKFGEMQNKPAIVSLLLQANANPEVRSSCNGTILNSAVAKNFPEIVKILLEAKANPLAEINIDETPLSNAVNFGAAEILNLFAAEGIDLKTYAPSDPRKMSAELMHAVVNGDLKKLETLREKGFNPNAQNAIHQTPLILAAKYGQVEVLDLLIQMGANSEVASREKTALTYAAKNGHSDAVKYLLGKGAKIKREAFVCALKRRHETIISQLTEADREGAIEILADAVELGEVSAVQNLLAAKVSYHARNSKGTSSFELALIHWKKEIAILFLLAGADGAAALPYATGYGSLDIADYLIDSGVELNRQDTSGMTALMHAASVHGSCDLIKKLIKRGARHDLKDVTGRSALSYAASYGREEMITLLIAKDAALDERDFAGRTPLSYAAQHGHENIVRCFIAAPVEKNGRDNAGRSPIDYATIYGHEPIVRLLMQAGVAINQRDSDNKNLLMHAASYGHESIVRLLLEAQADLTSNETDGLTPFAHAHSAYLEARIMKNLNPRIYLPIMDLLATAETEKHPPQPLPRKRQQVRIKNARFAERVDALIYSPPPNSIAARFEERKEEDDYIEHRENGVYSLCPPGKDIDEKPTQTILAPLERA